MCVYVIYTESRERHDAAGARKSIAKHYLIIILLRWPTVNRHHCQTCHFSREKSVEFRARCGNTGAFYKPG